MIHRTILFLMAAILIPCHQLSAQTEGRHISVIRVQATINPAIADFIIKSIDDASNSGSMAMIIELDTPGGLDTAMRDIVKVLLEPPIPVIVHVYPGGGRAASAGVLITMAANIAAMAPGTNIGAAHPVNVGGGDIGKEMNEKITNDAVAYIRGIAVKRGRNAEWAEKAVSKSESVTAEDALKLNIIDFIAKDTEQLLLGIDGRKVSTSKGDTVLDSKGVRIVRIEMGLGRRILNAVSDPNVAYILMMLGMYGLFFELANPGAIFPGVIGGISILLALYAFQTIPVNFAGVLLIVLSIALFIAESMVAGYGVLGAGGIVAMLLGSLMLFDSPEPYLKASLTVILSTVFVTAGLFVAAISFAVKSQFRKKLSGAEAIIGETGKAVSRIESEGKVFLDGEYWDAFSDQVIEEGASVRVIALKGLKLNVEKI